MATQFDYYLISGLSMLFTGHYMSLTSEPYVQCLCIVCKGFNRKHYHCFNLILE